MSKLKVTHVIVLFALSLFTFDIQAQQTLEFKIGINNSSADYIKPELNLLSQDSLYFSIPHLGQVNNIDSMVSYHINTSSFSKLDSSTIYVKSINSNYTTWTYLKTDSQNNQYLIEASSHDSINKQVISVYLREKNTFNTKKIFSDTIVEWRLRNIDIVNDLIFCISSKIPSNSKNLNLRVYDLSGNLLKQKDFNDSNLDFFVQVGLLIAGEHPEYPNSVIIKEVNKSRVFVLDLTTLDTLKTYGYSNQQYTAELMNNYGIGAMYSSNTRVTQNAIVYTGSCRHVYSTQPLEFEWQYFEFKQYWDGTFDVKTFGPTDVSNRGYAYAYNENQHTSIIAGAMPFDKSSFFAPEKRSVLVYIYDEYGKRDSLELFGNMNHVPFKIVTTANGDIFMAGTYKDVWSTNDVYAWLTKIPGIATSLVEQKAITNQLHLYPNPCGNELRVDMEANFTQSQYRIYNQTGQIIQTGTLTSNTINTAHLAKGGYILVVESEGNPPHNALFVKQ